jgi:HK97 family phage major capsid protein
MSSQSEIARKADLALADLTADGGVLDVEHQNSFYRKVIDAPTIFRDVRSVQMGAPEMKIPKIGFGSRVLRAAPNTGQGGFQQDQTNTRYLDAADRAKPDFGLVTMKTEEFIAEIHLHDDLLEDNLEKSDLVDTIMALLAERVALDLEELLISGDKASADAYLAKQDGILKLLSSNVVDAGAAPVSAAVFNNMKKAMPTRYRRNLNAMRFYTSMDVESDYRLAVSSRGTNLGDAILTGNTPLPVLGIPMRPVALMPEANGLLINPQNVLFGIQRNIRIERERDIRARSWIIVLTMRVAIQIEEEEAAVKLINLGAV